jgi:ZIP family zinc transporter
MAPVILRATLATLVALIGGLVGVGLGRVAARHLTLLVCMAASALLAVTLFDVLPDARMGLSWPVFLGAVGSGYLLFWGVNRTIHPICPACTLSHFDTQTTQVLQRNAVLLLIALGIHSTMDGLAVAVSDRITGHADATMLFALSFHKFPEGLALALLLIGAGYRRRQALLWTLAIQATTELGALLGVLVLRQLPLFLLSLIFAHVGGNFLYLARTAFATFAEHPQRHTARPVLIGSGLVFLITAILIWITRLYAR